MSRSIPTEENEYTSEQANVGFEPLRKSKKSGVRKPNDQLLLNFAYKRK